MSICGTLQISKPDGLARREVLDLAQAAGRVGVQHDAAEGKNVARDKGIHTSDVILDPTMSHRAFVTTQWDLHGPPM